MCYSIINKDLLLLLLLLLRYIESTGLKRFFFWGGGGGKHTLFMLSRTVVKIEETKCFKDFLLMSIELHIKCYEFSIVSGGHFCVEYLNSIASTALI